MIILLLAGYSMTFACDCFEMPSHQKEFRSSSAVFIGEVIKIENPTREAREDFPDEVRNALGDLISFKIIKKWKGSKTSEKIWTHATHEICSKWKFEVGKKYLVYLSKVKGVKIGAEFCSRTRPLETTDKEKIREQEELDTF